MANSGGQCRQSSALRIWCCSPLRGFRGFHWKLRCMPHHANAPWNTSFGHDCCCFAFWSRLVGLVQKVLSTLMTRRPSGVLNAWSGRGGHHISLSFEMHSHFQRLFISGPAFPSVLGATSMLHGSLRLSCCGGALWLCLRVRRRVRLLLRHWRHAVVLCGGSASRLTAGSDRTGIQETVNVPDPSWVEGVSMASVHRLLLLLVRRRCFVQFLFLGAGCLFFFKLSIEVGRTSRDRSRIRSPYCHACASEAMRHDLGG